MIRRATPFLLALMCLATTICPAVADTPSAADPPSVYARILSGSPGALQELQFKLMTRSLEWELNAYRAQTGDWPASGVDAIAAGLLPFVPVDAAGRPVEVAPLDLQQAPSDDALGLQLRPTEATLIQRGVDGDSLTPYLRSVNKRPPSEAPRPSSYPWSSRLTPLVEAALIAQCEAVLNLTQALPRTPAALTEHTGLAPRGWHWEASIDPTAIGVALEIDATHRYLRTTVYPRRDVAESTVYTMEQSQEYELERWPYGLVLIDQWELIGMLSIDAPLAEPAMAPAVEPQSTNINSGFSAQLTGQWILLVEYCRLASWQHELTGQEPSTEWLLAHDLTLHRFLTSSGEAIQPTPIPLDPNRTPNSMMPARIPPELMDRNILLQVDGVWINIAAEFPPVTSLPPGVKADANDRKLFGPSALRFDAFKVGAFMRQQPLTLGLSAEAADVERAIVAVPNAAPNAVRTVLWEDYESLTSGFSYRYLSLAGDSLGRCLQNWLIAHPDADIPAWDELLAGLQLSRHGYSEIATSAAANPDDGWVELAMSTDQQSIRVTLHHPTGFERVSYLRVLRMEDFQSWSNQSTGQASVGSPAATTLIYDPIANFAIPIPDYPEATS